MTGNTMHRRTGWALVSLAFLVSACGFQPLYADRQDKRSVAEDFADVKILPISNRSGQILRNELIDRMNPNGQPSDAKYNLEVRQSVAKQTLGIRIDETATRANMQFSASFRLIEVSSGAVVYKSSTAATTSYNIVSSDYGTISAERDARKRGSLLIAESITVRLAAYFNRLRELRARKE